MWSCSYRSAVVTFIDILGFSDLIEGSRREKNQDIDRVGKILRLLKSVKEAHRFGRAKADAEGKQLKIFFFDNFSDCIVRSTLFDSSEEQVRTIESELLLVAGMQADVTTRQSVMLRGGMAMGELYRDEEGEFIFGPAFVEAYRLEKKAVVPRIVISEDIMALMREKQGSFLTTYVRQDEDGVSFIDYLHGAYIDLDMWPSPDVRTCDEMLAAHKEAVENKNTELRTQKIDVRLKAHWMATYHNQVVERLAAALPYLEERIGHMRIDTQRSCQ